MLMRSGDRGVHRDVPIDQPGTIGMLVQSGLYLVPGAVISHPLVPLPDGLPRPEYFREVTPRDPAPIPVDDRLDHQTGVSEWSTLLACRAGHYVSDQFPLVIGEELESRHASTIPEPPRNNKQTRPSRPDELAAARMPLNLYQGRDPDGKPLGAGTPECEAGHHARDGE